MSAEPTAEHIDAVAQLVHVWIIDCDIYGPLEDGKYLCTIHDEFTASDAYCGAVDEASRRILTSTDTAAHAALAASLPAEVMLAALVDRGVLPDVDALRHHLAIAEADASHLAATIRDARESLARNRGRGVGWEKVSQALRPVGLSDALARAERRGRMHTVSAQPNPRFGQVAP